MKINEIEITCKNCGFKFKHKAYFSDSESGKCDECYNCTGRLKNVVEKRLKSIKIVNNDQNKMF